MISHFVGSSSVDVGSVLTACRACLIFSVSHSLCPSPACSQSIFLSLKINKYALKKNNWWFSSLLPLSISSWNWRYSFWGTWGAHLVTCLILGFSSGHDLMVHKIEPHGGLCSDSGEPAGDSLSPSLSAPLPPTWARVLSLSLKINEQTWKEKKTPCPWYQSLVVLVWASYHPDSDSSEG